jgi:hypothetical protein
MPNRIRRRPIKEPPLLATDVRAARERLHPSDSASGGRRMEGSTTKTLGERIDASAGPGQGARLNERLPAARVERHSSWSRVGLATGGQLPRTWYRDEQKPRSPSEVTCSSRTSYPMSLAYASNQACV